MTKTGIVFNVQRFTIHDGPGMRTEFFLKGCPLRCQWCSNPESWAPQPQVGVYRTKCIGRKVCGGCEDSCPEGDIFRFTAGKLEALCRACKAEGYHTCCESTFCASWSEVEKVLPYTDLIISDLKLMDSALHRQYTGVGNELILQNLRRLAQEGRELILRIPVIPGVNDGRQNIEASADFILRQLGGQVRTLQLLSFMRLGEEKYKSLGIPYQMEAVRLQRRAFQRRVEEIARYFNSRGIHCLVGTKEKEESQPE